MKRNALSILAALLVLASALGCASLGGAGKADVQNDIIAYLGTHQGSMPAMMAVDKAVEMALASHAENGGSTTSFRWGDLSGKQLFVVSLFPDLGVIKEGPSISKEELSAFAKAHLDLFKDPRVCLGTWFNDADGKTYIDINVVLADKAAAVELGKKYNQISIFDLSTFEETPTGGDGKPVANLPAPRSRLPEFR